LNEITEWRPFLHIAEHGSLVADIEQKYHRRWVKVMSQLCGEQIISFVGASLAEARLIRTGSPR